MESKVNYAIVGLFVIILTAAIIFGIIWLSSGFSTKTYDLYRVYMNESVTGLSVDGAVKYNGVDVGTVKEMELNPSNPRQVQLLLRIEEGTPITNSTTAMLTPQGITGVAYIDLQNKGTDTTPLVAKRNEQYPVIKSAPSLYFRVDEALNTLTKNFSEISASLNSLLDEGNRRSIKETLGNINTITGDLARHTKQLDAILQNTATASQQFPELIHKSKDTIQDFNAETIPKLNEILDNIQRITKDLSATSHTVKENPAVLIRGQTPEAPGPGER